MSDLEKAVKNGQVCIMEMNESEPPMQCRNVELCHQNQAMSVSLG